MFKHRYIWNSVFYCGCPEEELLFLLFVSNEQRGKEIREEELSLQCDSVQQQQRKNNLYDLLKGNRNNPFKELCLKYNGETVKNRD